MYNFLIHCTLERRKSTEIFLPNGQNRSIWKLKIRDFVPNCPAGLIIIAVKKTSPVAVSGFGPANHHHWTVTPSWPDGCCSLLNIFLKWREHARPVPNILEAAACNRRAGVPFDVLNSQSSQSSPTELAFYTLYIESVGHVRTKSLDK